ncbi:hypothetical protein K438DRAFT_1967273 [Mycena galopus ATCC 62051]|nr:hypothetical protein K438DRAFT_1824530 [Mycena galopus ATCC 62051]KAF8197710.1 hypothetical protein K438DRAFT_1967273 [Mycena galopus ATCC 62051]
MFFTRALLLSVSFAGLALASPTPQAASLEARTGTTASALPAVQGVLGAVQNLLTATTALQNANPALAGPVVAAVQNLLVNAGTGSVLGGMPGAGGPVGGLLTCLGGSSDPLTGLGLLSGLLGPNGLGSLVAGVLNLVGGILNGLSPLLSPLLNNVGLLLNSILTCVTADGGLGSLLQDVINAVNALLNALLAVPPASQGCGCSGTVSSDVAPLLSGLLAQIAAL